MDRKIRKLLVSGMAAATVFTAVAGCSAQNESSETSQTILTPPETAATETDTGDAGLPIANITPIPFDIYNKGNAEMVWKTSERELEEYYKNRGYYVFSMKNPDYPFLIDISMGEQDTDGYAIEIIDIAYDGSEMIVTVRETAPDDDAEVNDGPHYPGCRLQLSRYPDSLKIVNEDGDEIQIRYSNVVNAVGDWDFYFEKADGNATYRTYVTKAEDGTYRYINVYDVTTYVETKGITMEYIFDEFATGTADTKEELVEIAEKYGSCGNVTYRDDLFNKITPDDFLANENT